LEYKNATETIIGCAYRVYNKMGSGEIKVEIKPEFRRVLMCENKRARFGLSGK